MNLRLACCVLAGVSWLGASFAAAVQDLSHPPALSDTKISGFIGAKVDRFLAKRVYSDYARNVMFAEAERAFETHYDDVKNAFSIWF